MKDQYLVLGELRKIDEKVVRLKKELEKIPNEVREIENALQQKKEIFLKSKSEFDAYEKKLRRAEQDLREKEDFLKKAESKMMEVKTNDEYKAAMKENESHVQDKKKIEEEILNLMNGLEAEKSKLSIAEAAFKDYETSASKDKQEIETERLRLVKLFEEQTEKRKASTQKLSSEAQSIYEKTVAKGMGTAIEIVDNGMCLGCNMRIRAQLYNEVLGMKAIHKCPSCNRILVSQQIDAEVPTA